MKGYLSVCAIYKNEARYLAEWLEFHLLAGVEHLFLYNNDSTDDHREVLRAGAVPTRGRGDPHGLARVPGSDPRLQPLPRNEPPRLALDRIHRPGRSFSPRMVPVGQVLAGHEDLPAVAALWMIFGTSEHEDAPARVGGRELHLAPDLATTDLGVEKHRRPASHTARAHRARVPLRRSGSAQTGAGLRPARRPAPEPLHHEVRAGTEGEARGA